jgi:hypothetical protein
VTGPSLLLQAPRVGDDLSIEDMLRRALDAGVTPAEIAAVMVRGEGPRDSARCAKCGAELMPCMGPTVDCDRCGVRFAGEIGRPR